MVPQLSFHYTPQLYIVVAINLTTHSYVHSHSTFFPYSFTLNVHNNPVLSFPLNYPALQQCCLNYPSNIQRTSTAD
jgi:hypothetical protein